MSIYATLREMKLPKRHQLDDEWALVYAQAVPAHIGHPSQYPNGDPYADFLPPVVHDYDPTRDECCRYRAVLIITEGLAEKIGQRYTNPLLMLTGEDYEKMSFQELIRRIEDAMPWNHEVFAMIIGPHGEKKLLTRSDMHEKAATRKTTRDTEK